MNPLKLRRAKLKALFLPQGFNEIISKPANLYAAHRLSKIFSKVGRVARHQIIDFI